MTVPALMSATPKKAWKGTEANTIPSRAAGGRRRGAGSIPISGQKNSRPGDQEVQVHDHVRGVDRQRRGEQPREVQHVVAADEQRQRHQRVGEAAGHTASGDAASSHSRGPGGRARPAAGSARSASVTGAPRTSRIGTSIDRIMCSAMCTLNIAGPYRPMPELVATNSGGTPAEPARRSARAARRRPGAAAGGPHAGRRAARTIAAVPKIRSNRQSRSRRSAVGGSVRS